MSSPREGSACRRSTARGWRTASRAPPAARPTCFSTIARRSTCPAATSRSVATPCAPSAGSTRFTCAPATTSTCAGGCRKAGGRIEFVPAALVWHHHRASVRAYWRQQVGYGEGQSWLVPHHRERFTGAKIAWKGHIYSPLPFVRSLSRPRVNVGIWGSAAFPSVYHMQAFSLAFLPHTVRWQIVSATFDCRGTAAGVRHRAGGGHGRSRRLAIGLAASRSRCSSASVTRWPPTSSRSPTSVATRGARAGRSTAWSSRGCTCCSRSPGPPAICAACCRRRPWRRRPRLASRVRRRAIWRARCTSSGAARSSRGSGQSGGSAPRRC